MRTANPALNAKTFTHVRGFADTSDTMTIQGTVNKTLFMLVVLIGTAAFTWHRFFTMGVEAIVPWLIGGSIGGLIVALVIVFKKSWAPGLSLVYAALEGLAIGGLSAIFEAQFKGIVVQAVGLTFGTLFVLLLAYKSRLIRPTENFKLGVVAATGGICLLYLATFILGFFGIHVGFIHSSGPIGIGFSVVVVIIAALNLVLDFDFIESGSESGAPKFMEWYGAFGLMVTLIWLYIEILRLLAKMRSRR